MKFVLWMTGLPSSGKTTIARKLQHYVKNLAILDGDDLRERLYSSDFSRQGRIEHNHRVANMARSLLYSNVPVCVSLISPYEECRICARRSIGEDFIETYIKCSLKTCEGRDVKGMYKKARANKIKHFTGITDNYEIPTNPELTIDTENLTVDESVGQVLNYLKNKIERLNLV